MKKAEQVKHFKYLGRVISCDGYNTRDIETRIALAKKQGRMISSFYQVPISLLGMDLQK